MAFNKTTVALMVFGIQAHEAAEKFGGYEVRARTCTGYLVGTRYYCEYRLVGHTEWHESPEGDCPRDAVANLRDALAQRLADALSLN